MERAAGGIVCTSLFEGHFTLDDINNVYTAE
jgi:hypothetical protein